MNTVSIYSPSGFVGINTSSGLGATLQVLGNIYASNAISGGNLTVSGNIYYNEDLTKRSIHLAPSTANSVAIQSWISATCNASDQPSMSYWSTSQIPVYANITGGPQGQSDYVGSVLLPDGRVLFVPYNASNIGFFNPMTSTFSSVVASGLTASSNKFRGGVLLPNGNVVFVPASSSNAGMFNPLNYTYSNVPATSGFGGGVLAPNGNVVFIPNTCANIGQLNPTSLVYSNITSTGVLGGIGGVLIPNGNVVIGGTSNICMYNTTANPPIFSNIIGASLQSPVLAQNGNIILFSSTVSSVASFNPTTLALSSFGSTTTIAFSLGGGVLLPSGNIVYTGGTSIAMVDPNVLSASTVLSGIPTNSFSGATLIPSGQVVFTPYSSANVGILDTMTPAPQEFCLSPYFNKF
jgi:hypothetical protein